jgi:hypothetical protein
MAAVRHRCFDADGASSVHPIDRLAAVAKTAQFGGIG